MFYFGRSFYIIFTKFYKIFDLHWAISSLNKNNLQPNYYFKNDSNAMNAKFI